ncbi:hypothetical protein CS022_13630 [Veronia nyctiphanis]|uniref:Lipoprotein n=1 Tax=Veronia nyctiphanis TaxID=1278244 RepID=A0A4Q0YQP8_9GAMM|nr:hypothetical protein [Veronia nyctiphanis]RXJ72883.1 hypothetical protein CS022_13630 [Veronia nyctiphanis]
MFGKIRTVAISALLTLTVSGCALTSNESTASDENVIRSETELKIMKEATIAGTIGGVAVSALLIEKFGDSWPLPLKMAAGVGGTIAIQKIAEYIAMEQIAKLGEVTLENDQKEALLSEAKRVNSEFSNLNMDLRSSIQNNKNNKNVLKADLVKAKANKVNSEAMLKDRKAMLSMLVKGSEEYNEYSKEVTKLEKEDAALASVINELNDLGVAGV